MTATNASTSTAWMISETMITTGQRDARCNVVLRTGDEISVTIGRGTHGDRIAMILPNDYPHGGFVGVVFESRYGDLFAKPSPTPELAAEWVDQMIRPASWELGKIQATVKVDESKLYTLHTAEGRAEFTQWADDTMRKICGDLGFIRQDGWFNFDWD